jgi:hypothetical protein
VKYLRERIHALKQPPSVHGSARAAFFIGRK